MKSGIYFEEVEWWMSGDVEKFTVIVNTFFKNTEKYYL